MEARVDFGERVRGSLGSLGTRETRGPLVGLSFPGRGSVQDSRLLADCPLGVL